MKMKLNISALLFTVVFTYMSCGIPKKKYSAPAGYDFTKGDKFNMPSTLLEISGIALNEGRSDSIYSIQDEDAKLFRQKWDVKKQKNTKFGKNDDYEDVSIMRQKVFILNSNGSVFTFPLSESAKKKTTLTKEFANLVPKGEYEGLFADEQTDKVYILCKSCPVDKKAKTTTGYVLDYKEAIDSLIVTDTFRLDLTQLKQVNSKLKTSLSPSALAKNPFTNEWYILSSANKLLVVADAQWNIKEVHRLNSSVFNQPEGIAFDKERSLYISNEGDEITDGNILKFKYVAQKK